MNNSDWKKLQQSIKISLESNDIVAIKPIEEKHYGGFLALLDYENNLIKEVKTIGESNNIAKTVTFLISELKKEKIDTKNLNINLCIIKDSIYLKNPLDWDMSKDGVCFQWGNRYIGYYMPYEVSKFKADKVRILDRLCSWKTQPPVISSLWRVPEGMVYSIKVDWYK